ncbi:hypothetical protein XENOCAPTIV_007726 [Xenoophorus captivus]|uniref:Uncharacterized protein n=1 Tax=Xenoophorus captivus TaxID=1517983 RepID=A0ABV0RLP4_9TELE
MSAQDVKVSKAHIRDEGRKCGYISNDYVIAIFAKNIFLLHAFSNIVQAQHALNKNNLGLYLSNCVFLQSWLHFFFSPSVHQPLWGSPRFHSWANFIFLLHILPGPILKTIKHFLL